MTATPRTLLAGCQRISLLRAICPRRVPAGVDWHVEQVGFCDDRKGNDLLLGARAGLRARSECLQAGWGFEAVAPLPGQVGPFRASGWNGRRWVTLPSESLLFSPPLHVHVEIGASLGSSGNLGWPVASSRDAHPVSDALLAPNRRHGVSLGWVRWSGQIGQLVLAPAFPFGGEWGGHLIFYFTNDRINYALTIHAWMAALRLPGAHQQVLRYQSGPALPHVIATLKAIAGSALGPTQRRSARTIGFAVQRPRSS